MIMGDYMSPIIKLYKEEYNGFHKYTNRIKK